MSDGLPNPKDDPISPLFAAMMNTVVRAGGAIIEKGIEVAQEAPGKVGAALETVAKAPISQLGDHVSPQGDTVKAWKERELAKAPEITPPIPEIAQASALAAVGKSEDRQVAANDSHYHGNQGADVSLQAAMGKQNIAASLDIQVQQRGLA